MHALSLFITLLITAATEFPDSAVVAIVNELSKSKQDEQAICLYIDKQDPSVALRKLLHVGSPAVVPGSECGNSKQVLRHIPSGKLAGKVWLSDFHVVNGDEAEAKLAAYGGPRAGGRWSIKLKLAEGRWSVLSMNNEVIY